MFKRFVLASKLLTIFLLMIALIIPLSMIKSKVMERRAHLQQAQADIGRSWTEQQRLLGPLLIVPYTRQYTTKRWDEKKQRFEKNIHMVAEQLLIAPKTASIDNQLQSKDLYRGIFKVPVYSNNIKIEGDFQFERLVELQNRADVIHIGTPYLSIVVSDIRGIASIPELHWGKNTMPFKAGSGMNEYGGIHAPITNLITEKIAITSQTVAFSLQFKLKGMELMHFTPIAESNQVFMHADWPHPKFVGRYLPSERQIDEHGFDAHWEVSAFASDILAQLKQCEDGDCSELQGNSYGVELIDPIDIYMQSERSMKYAQLFIALTFIAFLMLEILRKLRIHPIQYSLVGLALSLFYLLLISLSEHIAFGMAYTIAASACIALLTYYIAFVLNSKGLGGAFGAALAGLYSVLYVIIQAEDSAFMMGSILSFTVLAFVMFSTRHIDWYSLSEPVDDNDLHVNP